MEAGDTSVVGQAVTLAVFETCFVIPALAKRRAGTQMNEVTKKCCALS